MNEGVGNCDISLNCARYNWLGIKTKLKQLDTELALLKTTQFQTETIQ